MKYLSLLIGWLLVNWHARIYKRNHLKTSLSRLALLYEQIGCQLLDDTATTQVARQDLSENVALIYSIISASNGEIVVFSELIQLRSWVVQDRLKYVLDCIDDSQLFALLRSHEDVAEKLEQSVSAA